MPTPKEGFRSVEFSARYINERRQGGGALTKKNFRDGEFLENCSKEQLSHAYSFRRAPRLAAETLVRSRLIRPDGHAANGLHGAIDVTIRFAGFGRGRAGIGVKDRMRSGIGRWP
jgi:hypothetical protein